MSSVQVQVALDKERHPERYCPHRRCLWRTGGDYCPRHALTDASQASTKTLAGLKQAAEAGNAVAQHALLAFGPEERYPKGAP